MVRSPKRRQGDLAEKAAILEMTLESMDQGVSLFDADLNVVVFNRKFLDILDLPPDRFRPGDKFEDFIRFNALRGEYGDGDVEEHVRFRVERAGRFEPHAFERARPDGTVIEVRGYPVPGGGFLTIYTDVTERKRVEQALREREERLALAVEAVSEGVYDWNIETGEIYYSQRVQTVLGLSPEDLSTVADWSNRIHPDDLPAFHSALVKHLKGETERFELDYRYRANDGTWRWARQHGLALRNEAGRAYRIAGSTGDVTEQKETEQALETVRTQLTDAIGSISEGFSLFDADDRLVLCNDRYKEHYPGLADINAPGVSFEHIIRTAATRGLIAAAEGREEDWVRERLDRHRHPGAPILQRQSDGRWIQINERKTGDGGTVAVFTDVTDLKRREEELALANRDKDAVLGEFNAVMDAIDYGILFLGTDLRPRLHNRAFDEMWEFQKELLASGATMREMMENVRQRGLYTVPDDEFEDYARARIEAIRKGDIAPADFHVADGRVYQYQCKSLPDGGRMLTYFDITALKYTEQALRDSEQRFRDFASSSSDWFYEMGPDLRFTYLSDRLEAVTGVPPDRVLGKTREEIGQGSTDEESWARHLADLRSHRAFKDFRFQVVAGQQRPLWISTSGVPVFDEDGKFQGFRGSSSDITEAILNEQAIRQAKDQAERALGELKRTQTNLVQAEKLALLGQLVAGIAHEIKNPLNFINNFADLSTDLLEELKEVLEKAQVHLDEDGRTEIEDLISTLTANLKKIGQHGGRADSIVKSMLTHSREGPGERRSANINALVEESLNLAYHGARAQDQSFNVTLERDFDENAGTIEIIPQDLSRVLLNLFANGFYATQKRNCDNDDPSFQPTLKASTRRVDGAVEIRVRDNGAGIPKDVVDKIFTPFFTTKPTGEGTGLGLSLSYDIVVHQHNGTFDVDTREGEYTEFIVSLPCGAGDTTTSAQAGKIAT